MDVGPLNFIVIAAIILYSLKISTVYLLRFKRYEYNPLTGG